MSLSLVITKLVQVNNPRGGVVVIPKSNLKITSIIDRPTEPSLSVDFGGLFNIELPTLSYSNYKHDWTHVDIKVAVNDWIESNKI